MAPRACHRLVGSHLSGYISGMNSSMKSSQSRALSNYRRRLKRGGLVRLEVKVYRRDAALVRSIANALTDPEREAEARALLRDRFAPAHAKGFKALLESAPLEGIDLSRDRDLGRDVAL
jgi:hypothetical protein